MVDYLDILVTMCLKLHVNNRTSLTLPRQAGVSLRHLAHNWRALFPFNCSFEHGKDACIALR